MEILRTLQIGVIVMLALVMIIVAGVKEGKQPSSDRPAESKGQLERLQPHIVL